MISYNKNTTRKQIYQLVRERIRRITKNKNQMQQVPSQPSLSQKQPISDMDVDTSSTVTTDNSSTVITDTSSTPAPEDNKQMEVDKSNVVVDHPFILKIVNANGTSCGKCRLNQTCIGCVFDEDDKPAQLKDRTMLAVEWDEAIPLENIYDSKAHKSYTRHSSASEGKDESEQHTVNLYDCLKKLFTTKEKLSPNDPWFCPKCKKHREATKELNLWKLPEILIVHLKRFQYNRYSRDKLNMQVDFPTENLELSEFSTNPAEKKCFL